MHGKIKWPDLLTVGLLALVASAGFLASEAKGQSKLEYHFNLLKPEGQGPFPAVMLVPGCAGLESMRFRRGGELKEQGYVALFVNYLSARGVPTSCEGEVPIKDIVEDIRHATAYLRAQPSVDPLRIGVLGWSRGSGAILSALADLSPDEPLPFQAAVLFYPACRGGRVWRAKVPVLMLLGEADSHSPPARCQELVQRVPEGHTTEVRVYPGARHMFDGTDLRMGRRNYNQQAATQSWDEVGKFFKRHLKVE